MTDEVMLFSISARDEENREIAKRLEAVVNTQPLNGILRHAIRKSFAEMMAEFPFNEMPGWSETSWLGKE